MPRHGQLLLIQLLRSRFNLPYSSPVRAVFLHVPQDQGAPARELVKKHGGIGAVVMDPSKMSEVIKLLDPGQQLSAVMVSEYTV